MPIPAASSAVDAAAAIAGERHISGCAATSTGSLGVAPAAQVDAAIGVDAERVGLARASRRAPRRPCRRPSPRPCTSCTGSRPCGCRVAPRRGLRRSVRPGTRHRGCAPRWSTSAPASRAMSVRYASRSVPRWPRRAFSKIANVSHAWKTSCATSHGSGGDSHGNGRFSSGLNEYGARSPRFLYALCVASASALVTSARSSSPASIASRSRSSAAGPSCRRCPSRSAAWDRRRGDRRARSTASSYCHVWQ